MSSHRTLLLSMWFTHVNIRFCLPGKGDMKGLANFQSFSIKLYVCLATMTYLLLFSLSLSLSLIHSFRCCFTLPFTRLTEATGTFILKAQSVVDSHHSTNSYFVLSK